MKLKLILAVLMLTVCGSVTAFSQSGTSETITEDVRKYDSLLLLAEKGLLTMAAMDTLQKYQRKVWQNYLDVVKENEVLRYNDSIYHRNDSLYKRNEKIIIGQRDAARAEAAGNLQLYTAEHNKNKRPWSLALHAGSNPFVKDAYKSLYGFGNSMNFSIGLSYDLASFSLRGLFASDTPAQLPEQNIRVIR
jgi:hypothetical protein